MAKRIIFFVTVVLSSVLILVLFFLKLNKRVEDDMNALIKSSRLEKEASLSQEKGDGGAELEANKDGVIKLGDDEVFISSISADVNEDGLADEIVAVKKQLNPSIYLVLAVQNSRKDSYERVLEVKTNVLVPQSLFFYTIQLQNSLPAIVCEGIGGNREKKLSIYLIKEDASKVRAGKTEASSSLSFVTLAQFSSDIQIQIQDKRTTTIGQLEDYSIETYSFAENTDNAFNQIRREYRWDENAGQFIKVGEERLKAKKEEDAQLKDLKNASLETYKKHLSGLWYMPRTVGENVRYLYYDKVANHLIFHIGGVQEIFEISNMFARRLGLSIVTVNVAIPTIKRRIEVEINRADEVQLRVTEDVATLRIHTASPWSGMYRKKQNTFSEQGREVSPLYEQLKTIVSTAVITWASEEGTLKMNNSTYYLKIGKKEEKGFLCLMDLNGKYAIEMKSVNNKKSLFIAELEQTKSEDGGVEPLTLRLTPASLLFAKVEVTGKPIVFKELME